MVRRLDKKYLLISDMKVKEFETCNFAFLQLEERHCQFPAQLRFEKNTTAYTFSRSLIPTILRKCSLEDHHTLSSVQGDSDIIVLVPYIINVRGRKNSGLAVDKRPDHSASNCLRVKLFISWVNIFFLLEMWKDVRWYKGFLRKTYVLFLTWIVRQRRHEKSCRLATGWRHEQ